MSNQRLPRWLSEGISVFEEGRARPEWARQQDMEFAALLARGEAVKLRELNAAFTDPRKISMAYFEASLLVEHLVAGVRRRRVAEVRQELYPGLDTDAGSKSHSIPASPSCRPGRSIRGPEVRQPEAGDGDAGPKMRRLCSCHSRR